MHQLAYAIALAVALIALPTTAQADDGFDPTPEQGPPCNWFTWSLDPPNAQAFPECIDLPIIHESP